MTPESNLIKMIIDDMIKDCKLTAGEDLANGRPDLSSKRSAQAEILEELEDKLQFRRLV